MAYSAGMRNYLITIQNRKEQTSGSYGIDSQGIEWEDTITLNAAVSYKKGMSAMREGSLDVYAVKMVRMNWSPQVNMRSRVVWQGQTYQIIPDTFDSDFHKNEIQFLMQLIVNES